MDTELRSPARKSGRRHVSNKCGRPVTRGLQAVRHLDPGLLRQSRRPHPRRDQPRSAAGPRGGAARGDWGRDGGEIDAGSWWWSHMKRWRGRRVRWGRETQAGRAHAPGSGRMLGDDVAMIRSSRRKPGPIRRVLATARDASARRKIANVTVYGFRLQPALDLIGGRNDTSRKTERPRRWPRAQLIQS